MRRNLMKQLDCAAGRFDTKLLKCAFKLFACSEMVKQYMEYFNHAE